MVTFAEPLRLSLLAVPALAAVVVIWRHRRRLDQQRLLASPAVWDRLMGGAPATGVLRLLSWTFALAMVILALARPQWGEMPEEESVRTRDLVIAIDVSDSMLCGDIPPHRLGRSLEILNRVMPAFEGNRVGAVVFAGDAYPLVPLTTDLHAVASFLDVVEPGMVALPGSNVHQAVRAALKLFPEEGEGRVLVLMTDGENLQGDLGAAASDLAEAGVGFLGVVAGTEKGGPIPVLGQDGTVRYKRDRNDQPVVTHARRESLDRLADEVDGAVIDLVEGDPVKSLIDAVDGIRTREIEVTHRVRLIERFPLFLMAAAAALIFGFVLSPWRRRAAVALLVLVVLSSTPLMAQTPQGAMAPPAAGNDAASPESAPEAVEINVPWWQRWIPGGTRRLARAGIKAWNDEDVENAVEKFAAAALLDPDDPQRSYDLGTSLAAAGDAENAMAILEQAEAGGAKNAAYNAGTAALMQQQAEPAVRWLREAVLADPDDPDVKRNYELALKLLEQQQQQQDKQDKQQDKQDEQKDEQEQQQQDEATPTPSPSPSPAPGSSVQPTPTPTPDPNNPLYAALEQAEADARDAMQTPTPQVPAVEKDW